MKKPPLIITALFVLAAVICFISATTLFAGLTDVQKHELQKCTYTYDQCMKGCPDQLSQSRNQIGECQQVCLSQYHICRQKAGIPGYVPGPGGSTGQTSPPNKS